MMLIIPSALVGEKLASFFLSAEVGDKKWTYCSFLLCLSIIFFLKNVCGPFYLSVTVECNAFTLSEVMDKTN